ncbi:hypothetical protein C5167_004325 [Papaver somniferum]|uniref:Uncharacterized protein n=1 Tax=Papaver somniferum TaxID=3469 RepID=A0A4Y7JAQ8_PAPSO|nr:hypothetical protein C5167_004325 [Papaver somniferum]
MLDDNGEKLHGVYGKRRYFAPLAVTTVSSSSGIDTEVKPLRCTSVEQAQFYPEMNRANGHCTMRDLTLQNLREEIRLKKAGKLTNGIKGKILQMHKLPIDTQRLITLAHIMFKFPGERELIRFQSKRRLVWELDKLPKIIQVLRIIDLLHELFYIGFS